MNIKIRRLLSLFSFLSSILVIAEIFVVLLIIFLMREYSVDSALQKYSGPPPWLSYGVHQGTAFSISPDGYLVTAAHVVKACRSITVASQRALAVPAEVLAHDDRPEHDFALLHIARTTPSFLRLLKLPSPQNSTDFNGDVPPYRLMGFPGPYRGPAPISEPIQSVILIKSRSQGEPKWVLGLEALLQPGESGGPILDANNSVFGIVTAGNPNVYVDPPGRGIAVDGSGTYGGYLVEWLAGLHLSFEPYRKEAAESVASDAIYRVFCFGRRQ